MTAAQRIGENLSRHAVVISKITMPKQLKAPGALGPTGRAKTSYTKAITTRITMANTPGCGTLDAA
jgi:hypothetical protein